MLVMIEEVRKYFWRVWAQMKHCHPPGVVIQQKKSEVYNILEDQKEPKGKMKLCSHWARTTCCHLMVQGLLNYISKLFTGMCIQPAMNWSSTTTPNTQGDSAFCNRSGSLEQVHATTTTKPHSSKFNKRNGSPDLMLWFLSDQDQKVLTLYLGFALKFKPNYSST